MGDNFVYKLLNYLKSNEKYSHISVLKKFLILMFNRFLEFRTLECK